MKISKFYNGNAVKDAIWDAEHNLGYRNTYNEGSLSWKVYDIKFRQVSEQIALAWIDREIKEAVLN